VYFNLKFPLFWNRKFKWTKFCLIVNKRVCKLEFFIEENARKWFLTEFQFFSQKKKNALTEESWIFFYRDLFRFGISILSADLKIANKIKNVYFTFNVLFIIIISVWLYFNLILLDVTNKLANPNNFAS
jgi:hypothetical protein